MLVSWLFTTDANLGLIVNCVVIEVLQSLYILEK